MPGLNIVRYLHNRFVFNKRATILAARLSELLPANSTILDIGCGDGTIDHQIMLGRPDVSITGIDLFVRPSARIPVKVFDGKHVPYRDASFDVALFIDVLHHTENPGLLLYQAKRISKKAIVIKDHFREGFLSGATLRLMDWFGNAPHGVALPYNYWSREEWIATFRSLSLEPDKMICRLGLYPPPASLIFERGLHFIARLPVKRSDNASSQ